MQLRDALLTQAPSLELHRAAQNEISRLDGELAKAQTRVAVMRRVIDQQSMVLDKCRGRIRGLAPVAYLPDMVDEITEVLAQADRLLDAQPAVAHALFDQPTTPEENPA